MHASLRWTAAALAWAWAVPAAGCRPSDPVEEASTAYVAAMKPLLVDNAALSRTFLDIAGGLKQMRLTGDAVGKRFSTGIVPTARDLAERAEEISPGTPELSAAHAMLVQAWEDRADAFAAAVSAWKVGDLDRLDRATEAAKRTHAEEDRYFKQVDAILKPYGLALEPYPARR